MNYDDQVVKGAIVAVLIFSAFGTWVGFAYGEAKGVRETVEASQRAAILAGAAKWSANKESGAPEFAWVQCNALGVTR